ncbi:MAG: tRNA preQ1(34) S-adenosylmethionine ribosyltransferase-isomerase QueA [Candidatus Eisenbacteria sp.]|nr:tRNA preQ1(34) S-adenosylmethionine ribosyltransferase-isomerase QueA [Candidatus Eisenbacteria bacterium]
MPASRLESLRLEDYDYPLPKERIAQHPAASREGSRLLVVHRTSGQIEHRHFPGLDSYLRPGDLLSLNETRVIPARLSGEKMETGANLEVFVLRKVGEGKWEALVKPQRRVRSGVEINLGEGVRARVERWLGHGKFLLDTTLGESLEAALDVVGQVPLPPYIRRDPVPEDRNRYQTVFATQPGAVAAPTAALHFTEAHLESLSAKGIGVAKVVLHTGLGTFRPITNSDVTRHTMEAEYFEVGASVVDEVRDCRERGGRVVAVGTTTTRALESAARWNGAEMLGPARGWTEQYIYPPFEFRVVDALVTNFHQPRSTLLLLVSAFAGRALIMNAYHEALERDYRFLSYGDAMLIL